MIAAPMLTPLKPFGAKLGVTHWCGWMAAKPTARNSRITASLMPTISVLTHDDSCTPITSTTVIDTTMARAGQAEDDGDGPEVRRRPPGAPGSRAPTRCR